MPSGRWPLTWPPRFRQGAVKDYRVTYRGWPSMSHVGEHILDVVARLFSDEFSALANYCHRHAGFALILPPLTGIAPALALAAAIGLVLIQVGGISLHLSRGEAKTNCRTSSSSCTAACLRRRWSTGRRRSASCSSSTTSAQHGCGSASRRRRTSISSMTRCATQDRCPTCRSSCCPPWRSIFVQGSGVPGARPKRCCARRSSASSDSTQRWPDQSHAARSARPAARLPLCARAPGTRALRTTSRPPRPSAASLPPRPREPGRTEQAPYPPSLSLSVLALTGQRTGRAPAGGPAGREQRLPRHRPAVGAARQASLVPAPADPCQATALPHAAALSEPAECPACSQGA